MSPLEKIAAQVPGAVYQFLRRPAGHPGFPYAFPYASPGIQDIYGLSPEQVQKDASPVIEVIHPDDLNGLLEGIERSAASLTPWHHEYRVNLPDGRTRWLEGEATPERLEDGGTLWHGHIRDITEKKLTDISLQQSQQKLLRAQHIARMGDFEWHVASGKVIWSEAMYRLLGYAPGEAVDFTEVATAIHHPDDRDEVNSWLQAGVASGAERLGPKQYRLCCKDGSVISAQTSIWIDRSDPQDICMYGAVQDISELVATEKRLKRLDRLIDQSSDSIFVVCARDAIILDANSTACHSLGFSRERLLELHLWDLSVRIPDPVSWQQMAPQFITNQGRSFEDQHRHKDGHLIPVEVSASLIEEPDGAVFIAIARDISARKQTEEQLKLQAMVLDQIHDHVTVTDLDGNILYVNQSEVTNIGHTKAEIVGRHVSSFGDDPAADASQDEIVRATLEQGGWQGEIINLSTNGERIWLNLRTSLVRDESGQAMAMVGIGTDISERKRAQQAIEEAGQRYQAVIASSKDGFLVVDIQGRIIDVNATYCRQSGYSRDELLGLDMTALDIEETETSMQQRIERMRQDGSAIFEAKHRRKDGSTWPVEVSLIYAPVQSGLFFSFLRDISERKVNQQLAELRQRLAEMVYSDDQEHLLRTALDQAEQMTGSQIGFMHFVEPDQETVALQTWSTRTLQQMCYAKGEGLHYPISQAGVWVDCIHQRQPVIHNDYTALPHKKGLPEGHAPILRELTVPVFRDGRIVAVMGLGNKPRDYDASDVALASRVADMTYDFVERRQAEQKIQFMAFNDVLTGLPNRQLFADRLQQAILLARRSKKLLAICYLDLDGFKPVNDEHGHEAGDQLLVQLAHRLQQELREGDTLARLGGDEFVVLLGELASILHGEEIVERLLRAIEQPFEIADSRLHLSASIGVTYFPHDDADADTLLRHADQAMYQAKESGKNTFRLYDPIQDAKAHSFRRAFETFDQALRDSQLRLHFQPRIDLRNGNLAGVEALVRWQHPERGLLFPDQFLPLIENSALEIALDEWVLRAAIAQHLSWREQDLWLPISVNLSPRHIQQDSFPRYLAKLLDTCPGDMPGYLELEVLETGAIGDTAHVAEIMNACAAFGVQFSLDDFGTGYSSLTYFHRLPISVLKIDQNFVREMLDDPRDQDIVEGVLRLADALDRPVVAEGVETLELGLMLIQLGCQYAQGYGIAKPMPPEQICAWAGSWQQENPWHALPHYRQGPTPFYDLNVAIISHRLWLEQTLHCLRTQQPDDCPVLDEQECTFAHWYRGIGASRYSTRPSYAFIQARHDQIHQLARTLFDQPHADNALESLVQAGEELEAMLLRLADA